MPCLYRITALPALFETEIQYTKKRAPKFYFGALFFGGSRYEDVGGRASSRGSGCFWVYFWSWAMTWRTMSLTSSWVRTSPGRVVAAPLEAGRPRILAALSYMIC